MIHIKAINNILIRALLSFPYSFIKRGIKNGKAKKANKKERNPSKSHIKPMTKRMIIIISITRDFRYKIKKIQ